MSMFAGTLVDSWKVPPADRASGECITRKLTKEEWKKYGPPMPKKEHDISKVKYMANKKDRYVKITKEQLLEECRRLGTGREACEIIAKKYNYSNYSGIQQRIKRLGIKEILEKEAERC